VHFDCAVNQGVGDAARFLQEALVGLDVDGEIGPKTLGAAQMADARETILEYAAIRESDYRQLSTFWKYGNGWVRRNAEASDLALSLMNAPISPVTKEAPAPVPQPQQEQPIMNETKQPTKPALNSMTLWGTVLTVVSTVLPVVAQAYGIPLTPDMVTGLGQEAATTLQALLGLLGSGMAIYGRVRADKPLSLT
jgi:lysozyme family protein